MKRARTTRRRAAAAGLARLALACVALLAPGCRGERPIDKAILILLDTVRADHVSAYGYPRPTTPHLDEWARRAVLFEQVVSFAPWTLPSAATILSGRPAGKVFDMQTRRMKASGVETLREAGFLTAAITEGGYVSAAFGMDLGFESFHENAAFDVIGRRETNPDAGIEYTFGLAREWVERHRDQRFFLLVHTYEPHMPYRRRLFAEGLESGRVGETFEVDDLDALREGRWTPNAAELEYLSALYDGGVHEADRQVGAFLAFLDAIGLRDECVIVVTSDHGEELGAHYPGHAGDHGHSLVDAQLAVPLIIDAPLREFAPARVAQQVRTMDILPTLFDLLGVAPDPDTEGESLVPLMRGEAGDARIAFGGSPHTGPHRVFSRHLGYKYIVTLGPDRGDPPLVPPPDAVQLYDLREDPGESRNLVEARPELAKSFEDLLGRLDAGSLSPITAPEDLDGELLERLQALGYSR